MTRTLSGSAGTVFAFTVVLAAGLFVSSPRGRADEGGQGNDEGEKAKIGLAITPVPLTFQHRDKNLVGYGSYLVNAGIDCNVCHDQSIATRYAPGGNPYFAQHPKKEDPATYLGGGRDFGAIPAAGFADIVSRNITPDKEGKPAGLSFTQFKEVIRTGVDPDKWHPTCAGLPDGHCLPAPFDGSLLQVMSWPILQDLTDHDLRAMYEYLSAIPCLEGDPGNPAGADTHGKRCT